MKRFILKNLHRLEDDVQAAGKVPGRDGLHLLAGLHRERAETFTDEVRRRWQDATGKDELPPEARSIIEQFEKTMADEADTLDRQASAATELEGAGVRTALDGLRDADRSQSAGRKGGRKSKRKVWAIRAAEQVARWDELPESNEAWEYEDLLVCVYRDGDKLCAADIDDMDAEPKTLARSTFEKRYLKKR